MADNKPGSSSPADQAAPAPQTDAGRPTNGLMESLKGASAAAVGAAAQLTADARSGMVAATAAGIAAAVRAGAAPAVADAVRSLLALRMEGFARDVAERLVAEGDARAAGQLCLAALQLGPEQAEAVRRLAVDLMAAGRVDTAAAVAEAFWKEAGAAGAEAEAAVDSAMVASQEEKEAAVTDKTGVPAAAGTEVAGDGQAAGPGEDGSDTADGTAIPPAVPASIPPPSATLASPTAPAATPAWAQPSAAELHEAVAVVLAAAAVEVVQLGHATEVVEVTEKLLKDGQTELARALVATMVDAGHSAEAGKLSVAALAAGKPGMVAELSAVLAAGNDGAVLGRVLLETTKEGAKQLSARALAAAGRLLGEEQRLV